MSTMNHSRSHSTVSSLDPAAGSNDNAVPAARPSSVRLRDPRELLADPAVVRAIRGTLQRHGMLRKDLADGVADVQLAALEATHGKPAPADADGWRALGCTIAERMMITRQRRDARRARFHGELGPDEDPDDYGPVARSPGKRRDPVDMSRQIAVARGLFEAGRMPEDGDLIMFRTADGFSANEIAEEVDVSEDLVEHRLRRMRTLFRTELASRRMLD